MGGAGGLDAREVLDPTALRIEERFVDAVVVRVALHAAHWLAEGDDLVAQREQVVLESVRLTVGLGQGLRIAKRGARF